MAQTHIYRRFAWQAWHLWHWVAPLGRDLVGDARGAAPLCVAGVAQPDIHLRFHVAGVAQSHIYHRFAWQAWHLWYWVAPLGRDLAPVAVAPRHFAWQAWHNLTSTFVSRGRRGTNSHLPSFCVAGVALMVLGGALGPDLVACDAAALCVAGVALGDIHLRFTWQAWHNLTSTVVLRGRRGTYGTGWRPWARVAHLMAPWAPRHFAWQAWHLWPDIHLDFTWQAWHNLTSTATLRGRRGTLATWTWHSAWQA